MPTPDVLLSTQHSNGTLYASGFALSLEEGGQPKISKSRVMNGEDRLIATIGLVADGQTELSGKLKVRAMSSYERIRAPGSKA